MKMKISGIKLTAEIEEIEFVCSDEEGLEIDEVVSQIVKRFNISKE